MIASAALLALAYAPYPPSPQETEVGEIRYQVLFPLPHGMGDEVVYLISDFRFRGPVTRITGDYAVLWLDADSNERLLSGRRAEDLHRPPQPPPPRGRLDALDPEEILGGRAKEKDGRDRSIPADLVREIYVEGTVYFSSLEQRVLRGERLYLDLTTGRALVSNGQLLTSQAGFHGQPLALSVKAEWFRREATGRFVADRALYSTCTFAAPHIHFQSEQAWLEDTPYGMGLDAYGSTFKVGETAVLYSPRTILDPETMDMIPFRGARIGTSSQFGFFVQSKWGQGFHVLGEDFNEAVYGERLPFRGSWEVRIDQMRKRGLAFGPELEWETFEKYKGKLRTYFLSDEEQDSIFYPGVLLRGDERRFVQLQNRIHLDKEWSLDAELFEASDPGFYPEFFRKEFYQDKEPESDLYLRWARDNQAATALLSHPINRFEPVPATGFGASGSAPPALKEALPELQHFWIDQPLFALPLPGGVGDRGNRPLHVYYTERSSAGYLKRHPSADIDFAPGTLSLLPAELEESGRFDTAHELRAPFHAGPFVLTPFIAERGTFYSQDVNDDPAARLVNEAGLRASTHLEKQVSERLLHLVDPSVLYDNIYAASKEPAELIQFDETEAVTKSDRVVFSLRNRLVDIPPLRRPDSDKPAELSWGPLADLDLKLPLFVDADRDNAGERYGDLETDFLFQTRIEGGPLRGLGGRVEVFSAVEEPWIQLHRMNFADIGIWSNPSDSLTVFATHRRLRNLQGGTLVNAGIGGGFLYRMGEKWHLLAAEVYDLETRETTSYALSLRRSGHDFVFDAGIAFNAITNDKSFSFNFQPRVLLERGRAIAGVSNLLNSSLTGQTIYTSPY